MSKGSLNRRRLRRLADPEIRRRSKLWMLEAARDKAHARLVSLLQRAVDSERNDDLEAALCQRKEAVRLRREFRSAWGQDL